MKPREDLNCRGGGEGGADSIEGTRKWPHRGSEVKRAIGWRHLPFSDPTQSRAIIILFFFSGAVQKTISTIIIIIIGHQR